MMELNGTSSIVTGGASGLGEATALRLAERGVHCVILDMNEEKGEQVASQVKGVFVKADVSDEEQVQAAVDAALDMGPLWSVMNSAGIGAADRTIDREGNPAPLKRYELVLRVNLIGTFNVTRLAASAMNRNEPDADGCRGSVVNTASVAAFDGQIGQAAYSASKGGVVGMTLPLARDLSAAGIRVNTIAPGLIDTPIYGQGEDAEKFKNHLGQSVLFPKRLGVADEIATMAIELLTNSYMNGETIRVDGGIRMPPR